MQPERDGRGFVAAHGVRLLAGVDSLAPRARLALRASLRLVHLGSRQSPRLCPDNRVSGGKVLKAKTRKVVSRVAAVLRMAAQTLRNSDHKLGEYCRRMKARLGKAEGITATAHKLARILYAVITRRVPYDEEQAFRMSPTTINRRILNLHKQATKLGLQLVPAR